MLKAGDILCHTHTLLLRTHTCAHVCSNRFCGLLPALFVVCFMVISVAWPVQRPITVWLMNRRVFTRATSVPATHNRQVAGQNTRALTSQARPESLRRILLHQKHYLYSFLVHS